MKRSYFKQIDGIRFYVFLLILCNHAGLWSKAQGHTFFFMLSGFLIGYTSYDDINKNGVFSLKSYFLRRILRTFPLYFLIILGCGAGNLIFEAFGKSLTLDNYWSYFLFVQNFFVDDSLFILKNLWAMAITEQLYLGWGLIIFALQRSILPHSLHLLFVFLTIAFVSPLFTNSVYENTLTYAGIYLLGSYAGLLFHKKDGLYKLLESLTEQRALLFFTIGLIVCLSGFFVSYKMFVLREHLLAFGFFICLLSTCYTRINLYGLFTNQATRYLGKISFGLYCYHAIILTLIGKFFTYKNFPYHPLVIFFITLLVTIFVASLSYELFEKKFLQMKRSLQK